MTIGDDLEMLKSQMDLLTRSMMDKNLISEEMIRKSVKRRIEGVIPSKIGYCLGIILGGLVFPCVVMWMTLSLNSYSLGLGIFTVLMSWFGTYKTIEYMRLNPEKVLRDGSLLDVTETITKMRRMNNRQLMLSYVFMFVWCGWFLMEQYSSLVGSIESIVLVSMVFIFVFVGITTNSLRIERTTKRVLEDIEDMRK